MEPLDTISSCVAYQVFLDRRAKERQRQQAHRNRVANKSKELQMQKTTTNLQSARRESSNLRAALHLQPQAYLVLTMRK